MNAWGQTLKARFGENKDGVGHQVTHDTDSTKEFGLMGRDWQ
jgi:hypothetical protein